MRIVVLLGLLVSLTLRAQVWEPLGGPFEVAVTEVATNSNDVLYFITSQGLHRSLDNGDTWVLLDNGLPTSGLHDLHVAANDNVFLFGPGNLLYRSVDDGLTWTITNNGQAFPIGRSLGSNAAGVLFMGTSAWLVQRSYDEGDTWSLTSTPLADIDLFASGLGDTIYAASNSSFSSGTIRSVDGGDSWTTVSYGLMSNATNAIGINPSGHVFAGVEFGTGLVRSVDSGNSWTQLNYGSSSEIHTIAFDTAGNVLIGLKSSVVLRSTDNGDSWSQVTAVALSPFSYALAVNMNDDIFLATGLDLFRSTNGGSDWTDLNHLYRSTSLGSRILEVNDSDHCFAAGSNSVLYRSTDQGLTWERSWIGFPAFGLKALAVAPNGDLFAGHSLSSAGVYRSEDNGATWMLLNGTATFSIQDLTITADGDVYVSDWNGDRLLRSADNGDNWNVVLDGGSCDRFGVLSVGSNDKVLAGAYLCGDYIYSSVDDGSTWTMSDIGPGWVSNIIGALGTRVSTSTVLAARYGPLEFRLFRSEDNAVTWQDAWYGLPDTTINALICHPTPGLALVGTPIGVYITNNDGDDWWPFNDGLTNLDVRAFAIDQNGYVLAGTNGGGVFRASLPVSVPEVAVNDFTLEQNTPNPCDGSTTITYSLRTAAHVQLTLLDPHGRTVAQLTDAAQPPGRNTVDVTTARLAPGLYAYALTLDGQRMTKRMMVVH